MRNPTSLLFSFIAAVTIAANGWAEQKTAPPENSLYEKVSDEVFLQEVGEKTPSDKPVTQIETYNGAVYAVIGGVLHKLTGGELVIDEDAPANLRRLFRLGGALWATTDDAVYRYSGGDGAPKVFDGQMIDLTLHNGVVHGATRDDVFRFDGERFVTIRPESGWLSSNTTMIMEDGTQILSDPVRIGPIERIASYHGTLYLLQPDGPVLLDGAVLQSQPVDWGMMPSDVVRDMKSVGSCLLITTDRGVAELRGAALTTLNGDRGLPYEDTTCIEPGFDADVWYGTTTGAIRQIGDRFHYFGADHWLPGDNVHDVAVDGNAVYIATDKGIGVIRYEPYTLRKKAAYFERDLAARGHKRLGFVHKLYWNGKEDEWLREISDNDGGHTAHYLAAMCFKYAVTQDEADRRKAVDAFQAMIWLQAITGTDGFFARSIWAVGADKGRRATQGSGGLPAKWTETDDGKWQFKGDTSSDEVNAHFYAVSLFHDLVAQGAEKKRAAEHLARIAKHIADNGWVLRDMDGAPTRWGRWDPEYLLRPYGFESRGLNGMEAQSYMWTAYKLSGDPFFKQNLDQLIKWRYHTYTERQKITFPPESVVTWDDELAFRAIHPLITYCDDPYLRAIYLRALARHWEVMRMQKIPFFNFIYGGLTGNDCESREATQHLREWSLNTVSDSYRNSHRSDLATEPGYTPYMGGTRALSPREQGAMWGSRSAIHYNGGGGGRSIEPPVGWLEDYWMGRYYGMIDAPTVDDASLVTVEGESDAAERAEPYEGPDRPGGLIE